METHDEKDLETKQLIDAQRPKYVVISQEDLEALCDRVTKVAADTALDTYRNERAAESGRSRDRRLHNTELLLRNYHMFELSYQNSVTSLSQVRSDDSVQEILSLMDSRDCGDITVESITESVGKTATILAHINKMLDLYRVSCEQSDDDLDIRRYEVLMDRYIREPSLTIQEIADKQHINERSVYQDLKIAKERLSALIFGIDGVSGK